MPIFNEIEPPRRWLLTPFLVYLLLAFSLLPFYRYEITPDGISYLSIAGQYASAHFHDAISLYWSPLYSWLIAPLLLISIPPMVAGKIVTILAGLAALAGVRALSGSLGIQGPFALLAISLAALMILAFAQRGGAGSDLLLVAALLLYFSRVFRRGYCGWICGTWGAVAYLSKAYAFPFFLVHFSLATAAHCLALRDWPSRRALLKHFLAGMLVFGALCAPWIYLISSRHGVVTFGTTGDYNYRLVGPMSLGHPHYQYLIPPPSAAGASSWDDPSPARLPEWSPFTSSSNTRHQIKLLAYNAREFFRYQRLTSVLIPTILLAYFVIGLSLYEVGTGASTLVRWFLPLFTVLIYPVPYLLVIVMDRYLWPVDLILLLMAALALSHILRGNYLLKAARVFLIVVFCGSFAYAPLRNLTGFFDLSKQDYALSQAIAQAYGIQGRLASCGDFIDSLYLAYQLKLPYFGSTGKAADEESVSAIHNPDYALALASAHTPSEDEIKRELDQYEVNYYLVWTGKSAPLPSFVHDLEDVTRGELPQLKIYRWKPR